MILVKMVEEYDKRLAFEFLVYPDKNDLTSFADKKRKQKLELFAMAYDKKVCKLAKTLLKNPKFYSGTKEMVRNNVKILHCGRKL